LECCNFNQPLIRGGISRFAASRVTGGGGGSGSLLGGPGGGPKIGVFGGLPGSLKTGGFWESPGDLRGPCPRGSTLDRVPSTQTGWDGDPPGDFLHFKNLSN